MDTLSCEVISSLPIELVSFEAEQPNGQVDLEWLIIAKVNKDYFTIERISDVIAWREIQTLPGAGNSSITRKYTSTNPHSLPGKSYYRLKQTDFDDQYSYSDVEAVDWDILSKGVNLYPSLTINELTLEEESLS